MQATKNDSQQCRKARPWTVMRSKTVFSHHIFSLRADTACNPRTGRERDYFVFELPDFSTVIPLTPDGQVVMVKMYRHGTRGISLEVPGGLVDSGETPLEAAHRELLEETGETLRVWSETLRVWCAFPESLR